MDWQKIVEMLRGLYIEDNPYRIWAWVLSLFFLMMFPRGTRRMGTTALLIGLAAMGIYFGMMSVYKQYTPAPMPSPTRRRY